MSCDWAPDLLSVRYLLKQNQQDSDSDLFTSRFNHFNKLKNASHAVCK